MNKRSHGGKNWKWHWLEWSIPAGVLIYAGCGKISVDSLVELYSRILEVWRWFPPKALSVILPWIGWGEIAMGSSFVVPAFRRAAATILFPVLVIFTAFHTTALIQGGIRSCGCLSDVRELLPEEIAWHFVASFAVLFCMSVCCWRLIRKSPSSSKPAKHS